MDDRNILLTGLPRSGTTLTCELLGSLPDVVALDEPLDRSYLVDAIDRHQAGLHWRSYAERALTLVTRHKHQPTRRISPGDVAVQVERFAAQTRESALTRGVVRTKSVDGHVTGTKVSDERDESGTRRWRLSIGDVSVGKHLSPDFTLVIKQCGAFTALLEVLGNRFAVYALVRNPLSVLASWQYVPMPIRDGHIPLAERLNPALAEDLRGIADPADRQFYLLGWFFGRFARLLGSDRVVSYEDVVSSGGGALAVVYPGADALRRTLADRNRARPKGDDPAVIRRLASRLLDTEGPWWQFYSPADVSEVLDATT